MKIEHRVVRKSKKCLQCGVTYFKKSLYLHKQWEKRKYCSFECSKKTFSGIRIKQWNNPEYRKMMSDSHKGNPNPMKGKKTGRIPWNKNGHHSKEANEKNRLAHLGKKASIETRKKQSDTHNKLKEKHWAWKGGNYSRTIKIRLSQEYRLWREAVFNRDDFTCVFCGTRGGKLNADHIKPFAYFPELRFDINNGRTLCVPCHKETDTYGHKAIKLYENRNKNS